MSDDLHTGPIAAAGFPVPSAAIEDGDVIYRQPDGSHIWRRADGTEVGRWEPGWLEQVLAVASLLRAIPIRGQE